ncbi:MAG: hypothetical protein Q4F95_08380 [Oscillospiraceae bacterium]|nr:hypothetical protein [Oscillospiraceae bacterium]
MQKSGTYDSEYRKQAIKLSKATGAKKASAFFAARRQKSGKTND